MVDTTPLIATPMAANANSYETVARADEILTGRLYTSAWDAAGIGLPDAADYQTSASALSGVLQVPVDTGAGTWTVGTKFKFTGHATLYSVTTQLTAPGTLNFTPALTTAVADDEQLIRATASKKEKALIWGTTILDSQLVWQGSPTTTTQKLRMPRTGLYGPDGNYLDPNVIPYLVELALAEFALELLRTDKLALPAALGLGVSEATIGPMSVRIDSTQVENSIPRSVLSILSPFGTLEDEATEGVTTVPLFRV